MDGVVFETIHTLSYNTYLRTNLRIYEFLNHFSVFPSFTIGEARGRVSLEEKLLLFVCVTGCVF